MQRLRAPFMLAALAAAVSVASCGGGGSSGSGGSAGAAGQGQLQVAITDAPGDFLAYDVKIDSITLKSANGAEVQTIPIASRIDFTQYTDLTELFNVLTVPAGTYTEVALNLDFSDAEILIEGNAGEEIVPDVVGEDGVPVSTVALQLQFPEGEALQVRAGQTAQLSIDFDLAASNEVDVDNEIVTVGPVLFATPSLDETREHRVRGLLDSVNEADHSFAVDLLPLYLRRGDFGEARVQADADTVWLIDGVEYEGLDGTAALAALGEDAPIIVLGSVSDDRDVIVANHVYAGSSVPWVGREAVQGVVIARDEDQLTVRGRVIEVGDDEVEFSRFENVTIDLSAGTEVTRQVLDDTGLDVDAISVGQRVTVFGDLAEEEDGDFAMDASSGHVHMEMNQVEGTVTARAPFVLDLEKINGRSPGIFDFTGTGDSVLEDVDPTDFEIATGPLSLANIDAEDFVKVRGYFNQYGAAPVDFVAQTIVDPNQYFGDRLLAYWNPSRNTDAILSIDDGSIELNTDEDQHGVLFVEVSDNGVVAADPLSLRLVADQDGLGRFAVKAFRDHEIDVFHEFETFEALVSERADDGQKLVGIEATGRYNEVDGTFEVSNAVAVFKRDRGHSPDWDDDHHPGHHKGDHHRRHGHGHGHGHGRDD